jgi:hypothetical protein
LRPFNGTLSARQDLYRKKSRQLLLKRKSVMTFLPEIRKSAAIVALPLAFVTPREASADTCRCLAHFELRLSAGGRPSPTPSWKPDIPVDHFTSGKDKGVGTMNGCRREAQHRAHSCMSRIWENRTNWQQEPSACSTSLGISGSVPYNIKWWIERTACQSPSPIANRHNAVVDLFRRTHGGTGCGDDLRTVKSVRVHNYEVDCLAVRSREKLGMVDESQFEGIDRPGSDFCCSDPDKPPITNGIRVGNGSVEACKTACNLRDGCRAWTWVPAGIQGPESKCWLKHSVPWHVDASGMVSGTRRHDSK